MIQDINAGGLDSAISMYELQHAKPVESQRTSYNPHFLRYAAMIALGIGLALFSGCESSRGRKYLGPHKASPIHAGKMMTDEDIYNLVTSPEYVARQIGNDKVHQATVVGAEAPPLHPQVQNFLQIGESQFSELNRLEDLVVYENNLPAAEKIFRETRWDKIPEMEGIGASTIKGYSRILGQIIREPSLDFNTKIKYMQNTYDKFLQIMSSDVVGYMDQLLRDKNKNESEINDELKDLALKIRINMLIDFYNFSLKLGEGVK